MSDSTTFSSSDSRAARDDPAGGLRRLDSASHAEVEHLYRQLLDQLPAAIYTCDIQGRIALYNRAAAELWGREPKVGHDLWCGSWRIFYPDGSPMVLDACPMAIALREGRSVRGVEIVIERPDGSRRSVLPVPSPIRDAAGAVIGAVNMLIDITDRRRAESELDATKDDLTLQVNALTRLHELSTRLQGASEPTPALRAILETIVDLHRADFGLVSLRDPQSGCLRNGPSIGLDENTLNIVANIVPSPAVGACGSAFATRQRAVVEDVITDIRFEGFRDAALVAGFRAVHSTPILTRCGDLLGVLTVHFRKTRTPTPREMQLADLCARYAADIIEASRSQQVIRESEERFRTLASHAPVGIFLTDCGGDCLFVNQKWCAMTGLTPEQAAGKGWTSALHPEDRQRVNETWYSAVQHNAPFDCEYRFRRPDGVVTWLQGGAVELRNADGAITGHIGTVVDITARKAAEAALTEAKEAAEAANRSKDKFLAVLSHELRTPLTPVLMVVAARQNDPDLSPDLRADMAMIRRNVELETKLIDDLLDLSRITSGKLRLVPQAVDLNDAVRHVCGICRGQILEKGIRLHCEFDPRAGLVTADPARLQQVLWNVIKNAAKFTPEGGDIHVSTQLMEKSRVAVRVRDTGVGIAPQMLPRIFDAFEQGESRITRQFGGLGLGLAISKALIDLHAGTIRAESDGPGAGAVFTIELPARFAVAQSPPVRVDGNSSARPAKLRLLIVEDHPDTAAILAKLLNAAGYTVSTAHSAASALNLASNEKFDLLISDIGLPDATGYELMQQLREQYALRGIAMSGYGMDEDIKKSREAGFADHLVKPINLTQLHDAIRRLAVSHP